MKTLLLSPGRWTATVLLLCLLVAATVSSPLLNHLRAQGSLTPPGAPGPTMKTLAQVEPRTDLATLAGDSNDSVVISAAGSYYLSANLAGVAGKNGILINADNVSIDLNGFAVVCGVSGTNSLSGIVDSGGHRNLAIHNGTVRGWGLADVSLNSSNVELHHLRLSDSAGDSANFDLKGCGLDDRSCTGARVADCVAANNFCDGFATGSNTVLTGCVSNGNNSSGFSGYQSVYTNCSASGNVSTGFFVSSGCVVTNCAAIGNNTQGAGFILNGDGVCAASQASGNKGNGFSLYEGVSMTNCVVNGNGSDGFYFTGNNLPTNNVSTGNAGDGFHGYGVNNRLDSNHAIGNTLTGILSATSDADFVMRNTSYKNGTANYNPASGSYTGPIGTPGSATSPWANF